MAQTPDETAAMEERWGNDEERAKVSLPSYTLTFWPVAGSTEQGVEFVIDELVGRVGWLEIDSYSVPVKIERGD